MSDIQKNSAVPDRHVCSPGHKIFFKSCDLVKIPGKTSLSVEVAIDETHHGCQCLVEKHPLKMGSIFLGLKIENRDLKSCSQKMSIRLSNTRNSDHFLTEKTICVKGHCQIKQEAPSPGRANLENRSVNRNPVTNDNPDNSAIDVDALYPTSHDLGGCHSFPRPVHVDNSRILGRSNNYHQRSRHQDPRSRVKLFLQQRATIPSNSPSGPWLVKSSELDGNRVVEINQQPNEKHLGKIIQSKILLDRDGFGMVTFAPNLTVMSNSSLYKGTMISSNSLLLSSRTRHEDALCSSSKDRCFKVANEVRIPASARTQSMWVKVEPTQHSMAELNSCVRSGHALKFNSTRSDVTVDDNFWYIAQSVIQIKVFLTWTPSSKEIVLDKERVMFVSKCIFNAENYLPHVAVMKNQHIARVGL